MTDEKKHSVAIYKTEDGSNEITVHCGDQTVWATQTEIAEIFGKGRTSVVKHLGNIFKEGELEEEGNVKKIHNGFDKPTKVYSLDAIISVGYRVNSKKATHFRQWATKHLKLIATDGYSVDEKALTDSGKVNELYDKIRKIRVSEANLYGKVRDVFKESSADYDSESKAAKTFFAVAQDKFHFAVTEKTAAELVLERSDGTKDNVGMTSDINHAPQFQDVKTAKNYLDEEELRLLENISEQFLLFAESKAFRGQKMTMEQISHKLNTLLEANDYPVLWEYKGYKRPQADAHAKAQLQTYRNRLKEAKVETDKPLKIDKPFDEAMQRIVRVNPKEES